MILDIASIDTAHVIEDNLSPNRRLPEDVRAAGYIPYLPDIKVGDLVLFWPREPAFHQRLIIRAQRSAYNESEACFTHAAVYLDDYLICEAVRGGVSVGTLLDSLTSCKLLIRRPSYEEGEDGFKVAMRSLMRLSQSYNYGYLWQIFRHSLSGLHKDRFPHIGDRLGAGLATICSMLYADSFAEATDRGIVSMSTGIVLPADLAASSNLENVRVRWKRLPNA